MLRCRSAHSTHWLLPERYSTCPCIKLWEIGLQVAVIIQYNFALFSPQLLFKTCYLISFLFATSLVPGHDSMFHVVPFPFNVGRPVYISTSILMALATFVVLVFKPFPISLLLLTHTCFAPKHVIVVSLCEVLQPCPPSL